MLPNPSDDECQALQRRIGDRIRKKRTELKLTQELLAENAGMGWRHLQKIEAGEINLTLRTLCRVASALQVKPQSILLFSSDVTPEDS
jgi:transcriptional regulator with XRE-family HTH domain